MKDLINWHELSRRLSGSGQNIRPNAIPKKYERKVNRLLKIIEVWERWQKNKATEIETQRLLDEHKINK